MHALLLAVLLGSNSITQIGHDNKASINGYGFQDGNTLSIQSNGVVGLYMNPAVYDANHYLFSDPQPKNPYCLSWLVRTTANAINLGRVNEVLFSCDEDCVKETCECHAIQCVREAIMRSSARSDAKAKKP